MKKALLFILFLLFTNNLLSQEKIDKDKLIEDFDYLVQTIEKTHPDPYTSFGGKIEYHREAYKIKKSLKLNDINMLDYYFLLTSFVSNIHDGHTFISVPEEVKPSSTRDLTLPLSFKIVTDAIFIDKSLNENRDLIGSKIISINKITIDDLLKKVQLFRPCENEFGAKQELVQMIKALSTVKYLFSQMKDELLFTVSTPQGDEKKVKIKYKSKDEILKKLISKSTDLIKIKNCLFDYQLIANNKIGYFVFNEVFSREVFESIPDNLIETKLKYIYKRYSIYGPRPENNDDAISKIPSVIESFSNLLEKMKENNSTHLVIDLRKNGGGRTPITVPLLYLLFGDKYFAYNCHAEYNRLISDLYLKKMNTTIEELNKNWHTDFKIGDYQFGYFWSQDTSLSTYERRDAYIQRMQNAGYTWHEPMLRQEALYTPKVIVITSPYTVSAAFHFMYFLKYIGNAIIVGTPPRQAGNAFMEITNFKLPNTKWNCSVSNSSQVFFPNDKEMGKTFQPDIKIKWFDCKKYNFDEHSELLFVIDLIKENRI